jgi:hypothetical protein
VEASPRQSRVCGLIAIGLAFLALIGAISQPLTAQAPAQPASQTFSDRLAFGKSMYVHNEHGSDVPFDVISSDLQGWGRFTILNSEDNAELIAEVNSYESGAVSLGTTRNSTIPDSHSAGAGMHRDLSSPSVRLTVYEAKTKRELWSGTEKVKSAFKKKTEQDNLVPPPRSFSCDFTMPSNRLANRSAI